MTLFAYRAQTQSLLDDFGAVEYTLANLDIYINDARVQISGASESLRAEATMSLVGGTQIYPFPSATGFITGFQGLLSVRMARVQTATGYDQIEMRTWEWFNSFQLSAPVTPIAGAPTVCAAQRTGINGVLYFSPVPDQSYTVLLNGACYPIALVDDNTTEVLSSPWTEAVSYYAAYLALLNAQRSADANAMFARYKEFELRATEMTTPTRLPRNYPGGVGARLAGQHMPITAPMPAAQGGR